MKYSFKNVDSYLDSLFGQSGYALMMRVGKWLAMAALLVLVGMCTVHFAINQPVWQINLVRADLQRVADALRRFDDDCRITALATGRHTLEGLTCRQLDYSVMPGVTVEHADRWQGPYLHEAPHLQGISYELLKTDTALYIVPGDGVVLPNGMKIGRDLAWHATTNIAALSRSGGPLFYQNSAFARRVSLPLSATRRVTDALPPAARRLSNWFAEFGDAMAFAANTAAPQCITL